MSKTFNSNNYPNLLPGIRLTSNDICNQIKNYNIPLWGIWLDEVEDNKNGLPMFIRSFYNYILKHQKIPTSKEFYNHYLEYNSEYFKNNNKGIYFMIGLEARCYRLWPSLIRELHFIKYVSENIPLYYDVIYNINLDVKEGIDMMIVDEDKYCGINLYILTKKSKSNKEEKPKRHNPFNNVKYIDHPIDIHGDSKYNCGEFKLYNNKSFVKLINKL